MNLPNASQAGERPYAVVDLIGDLDATLGSIFAETLTSLVANGTTEVFVSARHGATSSPVGLATIDEACSAARRSGATVAFDPGNRRMRAACATMAHASDHPREVPTRGARHFIIARHAQPTRGARIG